MTDLGVLQEGRMRRSLREAQRRRERRRRRIRVLAAMAAVGVVVLLVFMATSAGGPNKSAVGAQAATAAAPPPVLHHPGYTLTADPRPLNIHFKKGQLTSGLLFDVRSGKVLWEQDPTEELPIASLTKMMTSLVVVGHAKPSTKVLITPAAVHFSGSGVGLLPKGKHVPLVPLLYGLLLPSGNDAAIALAQHVAGTEQRFIAMMNAHVHAMDLRCTHYTTVSGIIDQGNYSCADDLAVLAHAMLTQRLLSRIVASRSAVLPFPIKGGKLFLYNNNPLLIANFPGADGVKTGFTTLAGPCLVAAARRGRRWYAVVLLHSENETAQAEQLLSAAFARG